MAHLDLDNPFLEALGATHAAWRAGYAEFTMPIHAGHLNRQHSARRRNRDAARRGLRLRGPVHLGRRTRAWLHAFADGELSRSRHRRQGGHERLSRTRGPLRVFCARRGMGRRPADDRERAGHLQIRALTRLPWQHNLLRRLDLTTLQLFLAVYEEGALTRAAERETIAVSVASKRLLELEQAVGAVLFERRARGMDLTPAGETLLHHARRVLRDIENIGIELAEHASGVRGYVRTMATCPPSSNSCPRTCARSAPSTSRSRSTSRSGRAAVSSRAWRIVWSISVSVRATPTPGDADTRGLKTAHYCHNRLAIITPGDHPLAGRKTTLSPIRSTATTSACIRPVPSICDASRRAASGARCVCASTCRGLTPCAGWCRPAWASACCRCRCSKRWAASSASPLCH